jgi:hypothetical protein
MAKWVLTRAVCDIREIVRDQYPIGHQSLNGLIKHLKREPDYRFHPELLALPNARRAMEIRDQMVVSGELPAGTEPCFHPIAMRMRDESDSAKLRMIDRPPLALLFLLPRSAPGYKLPAQFAPLAHELAGVILYANVIFRDGSLYITPALLAAHRARRNDPGQSTGEGI